MKLIVRNRQQKAILLCELIGQISDGFWENAVGTTWEMWCQLNWDNVIVSKDESEHGFYDASKISTRFNFVNDMLLECVGDRMRAYAKLSMYMDDKELAELIKQCKSHHYLITTINEYDKCNDERKNIYLKHGITREVLEGIIATPYQIDQLIEDMEDLKKIIKIKHCV